MTDILFFFDYSSSFLFFGPIIPGHVLLFWRIQTRYYCHFLQRVDICIFRPCTVILHFGLNVFFHLWYLYLCCVCLYFTHPTKMPLVWTLSFWGFHFSPSWQSWTQTFSQKGCCCFYFIYFNSKDKNKTDNFWSEKNKTDNFWSEYAHAKAPTDSLSLMSTIITLMVLMCTT